MFYQHLINLHILQKNHVLFYMQTYTQIDNLILRYTLTNFLMCTHQNYIILRIKKQTNKLIPDHTLTFISTHIGIHTYQDCISSHMNQLISHGNVQFLILHCLVKDSDFFSVFLLFVCFKVVLRAVYQRMATTTLH